VAFDQLEGTLTRSIAALDALLFDLVAKLEASIDFPDEGYHFVDPSTVASTLREVGGGIDRLLGGARLGRVIREGRQVAIVGKPNVGKSSLFNWLVGAERAIVTDIPGTTRDLLREAVDFDGVRLSLVDTAGIRDVQDEVEREGVARARRVHEVADLVCVVLDGSRPLERDDEEILAQEGKTPRLVIVNKVDLPRAWPAGEVELTGIAMEVSLKTGAGLSALRDAIGRALDVGEPRVEEPLVTNIRHEVLLRAARESLDRALSGVEAMGERFREELVLADLAAARRAFDEVVGKRTSEDVLRAIFERFCIGK
jgi:tRNA modification GTPase